MDGELIEAGNYSENGDGFGITAVTKLRHADLWAAAKRLGSQVALAREIGVRQDVLNGWVTMRTCPRLIPRAGTIWTVEFIRDLERKLLAITGKTLDELFPKSLRDNVHFLSSPKTFERTRVMEREALRYYAQCQESRLQLEHHAEDVVNSDELSQRMNGVVGRLRNKKDGLVVKMLYGLGEYAERGPATVEEVSIELGVTKVRVQQRCNRALKELKSPKIAKELAGFTD